MFYFDSQEEENNIKEILEIKTEEITEKDD